MKELEAAETILVAAGGSGGHQPDQAEAEAEVNAAKDGGHFVRFGEPAPPHRGVHAGVHLGITLAPHVCRS